MPPSFLPFLLPPSLPPFPLPGRRPHCNLHHFVFPFSFFSISPSLLQPEPSPARPPKPVSSFSPYLPLCCNRAGAPAHSILLLVAKQLGPVGGNFSWQLAVEPYTAPPTEATLSILNSFCSLSPSFLNIAAHPPSLPSKNLKKNRRNTEARSSAGSV